MEGGIDGGKEGGMGRRGGREGREGGREGGMGGNEGASTRVSLERFVILKVMKNTHTVQRGLKLPLVCRGAFSAIEPERN